MNFELYIKSVIKNYKIDLCKIGAENVIYFIFVENIFKIILDYFFNKNYVLVI